MNTIRNKQLSAWICLLQAHTITEKSLAAYMEFCGNLIVLVVFIFQVFFMFCSLFERTAMGTRLETSL